MDTSRATHMEMSINYNSSIEPCVSLSVVVCVSSVADTFIVLFCASWVFVDRNTVLGVDTKADACKNVMET